MATTYRGVGVCWGVGTTAVSTVTGALQTRDHTLRADMDETRNGEGVVVQKTYYNPTEEASFEFVASGTNGGTVTPTLPAIGSLLTVTDTVYTPISGSAWLVDEVSTAGSNTSAVRITLRMTKYPNITS